MRYRQGVPPKVNLFLVEVFLYELYQSRALEICSQWPIGATPHPPFHGHEDSVSLCQGFLRHLVLRIEPCTLGWCSQMPPLLVFLEVLLSRESIARLRYNLETDNTEASLSRSLFLCTSR